MAGFENNIVFAQGVKVTTSSADSIQRMQETSDSVGKIVYVGNPNGVISANPSSLCHDPTSGNVYFKQTGTGNTGWMLIAAGEGEVWSTISASQTLAINNGYICISPGGALSLALPAVSAVGSIIEVTLDGATSFTVTQSAGQSIVIGNDHTTAGVTGSLASTQQGDSLRMVCSVANLRWNVLSSMGNLTVI
jgi:hypothetical protein